LLASRDGRIKQPCWIRLDGIEEARRLYAEMGAPAQVARLAER
jgi:hypothetical protein